MNPGRLNKKITLQKLNSFRNEYGELNNEWQNTKKVWAEIKPLTGKSFFSVRQVNSEVSHSIIIRYIENIQPDMRILYQDRVFDILYIIDFSEKHRMLQLMCKELVK